MLGKVLLVLLFGDEIYAPSLPTPFFLEFRSGSSSPEEIAARIQLKSSFLPGGATQNITAEQIREKIRQAPGQNPPEFESIYGIMYCLETSAALAPIAFRRCFSQDVFDEYVAERAKRIGASDELVHRSGNFVRIAGPPPQRVTEANGTVLTITTGDTYFNFGQQLMVFGGEPAFRAPIGAAEEIVRCGAGKSWGYWFKPSNISPSHRSLYTAAFDAQIGAWQQRRDGESKLVGRFRKLMGENVRTIANTLLDDIEEAFLWTQNATIDRDFEAHLKVTVRPDSTLSHCLAGLRSQQDLQLTSSRPIASFFSARMNLQIPSAIRDDFGQELSGIQNDAPELVGLLQALLERGSFQCDLNGANDSDTEWVVSGAVSIPEGHDALHLIESFCSTATVVDSGISIPVPHHEVLGKMAYDVFVTQAGNEVQFRWSNAPLTDSIVSSESNAESNESPSSFIPASRIFHAEGDFSKINPDTQLFIVQCLERQAQRWQRAGLPPHLADRFYPIKLNHSEQICAKLRSLENTKVSMDCSINDDGTELSFDCTIGRDLVLNQAYSER